MQAYIYTGPYEGKHGRILETLDFGRRYRVLVPGFEGGDDGLYYHEPRPDEYLIVASKQVAPYFNCNTWVRITDGGWAGYSAKVLARHWNGSEFMHDVLITAESQPVHPMDYLPSDVRMTLGADSLSV